MRTAVLIAALLLGSCTQPSPNGLCDEARFFLHGCGVSLPLLGDGACVGIRLATAECIIERTSDCRDLADLAYEVDECVADYGDQAPEIPDFPEPRDPEPENPPSPEDSDQTCSDGLDNDEDGFADCDDTDCTQSPSISVCSVLGPETTDVRCSDGLDNDDDGYIDCRDFDCAGNLAISVCLHEADDASCSDGIDNDDDGFIDCADFNCQTGTVTVCP